MWGRSFLDKLVSFQHSFAHPSSPTRASGSAPSVGSSKHKSWSLLRQNVTIGYCTSYSQGVSEFQDCSCDTDFMIPLFIHVTSKLVSYICSHKCPRTDWQKCGCQIWTKWPLWSPPNYSLTVVQGNMGKVSCQRTQRQRLGCRWIWMTCASSWSTATLSSAEKHWAASCFTL